MLLALIRLSTTHLPARLRHGGLCDVAGVEADRLRTGWLLTVPDDPHRHAAADDNYPAAVLAVQSHARRRGADYVLLDDDADTVDTLPTWPW
jgi:hypothetical protein